MGLRRRRRRRGGKERREEKREKRRIRKIQNDKYEMKNIIRGKFGKEGKEIQRKKHSKPK